MAITYMYELLTKIPSTISTFGHSHPFMTSAIIIIAIALGLGITIFDIDKLPKKTTKKSFAEICHELKEISKQLHDDKHPEEGLWKELQFLFNDEKFHKRIEELHAPNRDEGKKLIKDLKDLSAKNNLNKNDGIYLDKYAEELDLLSRFEGGAMCTQKRKFLTHGISFIAGGVVGGGVVGGGVVGGGVVGGGVVGGGVAEVLHRARHKNTWKYLSSFNTRGDHYNFILDGAMDDFCKLVDKMTNGELKIERNDYKDHNPQVILSDIDRGSIDCGLVGIYYSRDMNIADKGLIFGTGIPFGLNTEEQTAWLMHTVDGKYGEDWKTDIQSKGFLLESEDYRPTAIEYIYNKIYDKNVIPIPLIATGGQMGGFFEKRINSTDDLSDVRMRIPGLGGKVLKEMNGKFNYVEMIAPHEIAEKINSGAINAFEFTGPFDDDQIYDKLNSKETFIYHYPGWWEPGTTFVLLINRTSWDKLNKSFQCILRAACAQIYKATLTKYNIENGKTLKTIPSELHKFDPYFLENAEKITNELLGRYERNDRKFKEAYKIWKDFRDSIRGWSKLSVTVIPSEETEKNQKNA